MSSAPVLDRMALAAARLWAAQQLPYFATALFALEPIPVAGLATMAVDSRWRLYVDPAVVEDWSVEECGAVLVHEVNHVLRDHSSRAEAAGVADIEALGWNVACDAEINDDLIEVGLPLPGHPVRPKDLGCPDGRLAEEYYQARKTWSVAPDCGSGAHGQLRDWERGDGAGLDPRETDLLRRQVAADVRAARNQGVSVPGGVARWAEAELAPTVDWRRELAAEVRRAVAWVSGRVDYTFTRRSRRASAVPGVVLPGLARPVPEVAVVCDTSGSMGAGELALVLGEVQGVLSAVGVRERGLTVLSVDSAVQRSQRVRSAGAVRLQGGGGTSLTAGLDACSARHPRPGVVVVLTDGLTDWPAEPPRGMAVIIGLVGTTPPDVPAWARAVRIGTP